MPGVGVKGEIQSKKKHFSSNGLLAGMIVPEAIPGFKHTWNKVLGTLHVDKIRTLKTIIRDLIKILTIYVVSHKNGREDQSKIATTLMFTESLKAYGGSTFYIHTAIVPLLEEVMNEKMKATPLNMSALITDWVAKSIDQKTGVLLCQRDGETNVSLVADPNRALALVGQSIQRPSDHDLMTSGALRKVRFPEFDGNWVQSSTASSHQSLASYFAPCFVGQQFGQYMTQLLARVIAATLDTSVSFLVLPETKTQLVMIESVVVSHDKTLSSSFGLQSAVQILIGRALKLDIQLYILEGLILICATDAKRLISDKTVKGAIQNITPDTRYLPTT